MAAATTKVPTPLYLYQQYTNVKAEGEGLVGNNDQNWRRSDQGAAKPFSIHVMVAARGVALLSPTPTPLRMAMVARVPVMEEQNA